MSCECRRGVEIAARSLALRPGTTGPGPQADRTIGGNLMQKDEWGVAVTGIGRRYFKNGSDYYQPLVSRGLSEDARALDISACFNRKRLAPDGSFSYAVAQIFYCVAIETDRPWGLRQPWAVAVRGSDVVPEFEALTAELVRTGYWLEASERLRLADAEDLVAYWKWFDSEQRRRANVRRLRQDERERIFARDGCCCAVCGSTSSLVIDHIVPVASGGGKAATNLRVLCRRCNSERNLPTPPRMVYPPSA